MLVLGVGWTTGDNLRRQIVEYERNPILRPFVHDAVVFLVVHLISPTDGQLVGPSIDHKPDSWIGRNGNMNTVSSVERRVPINVGLDNVSCG